MNRAVYRLTDIQQRYGTRTVLRIPSLEVYEGETLALVGPSGAGKSTLLRMLALLETPSEGTIAVRFSGKLMPHDTDTRRQIGMVFQRPLLLSRSVRANVAYGLTLRGQANQTPQVEAMLERVDMRKLADVPAHTLSGGEIQRVALARALVLEPRVLVLDEPTANLDPANVRIIETLLREQHERFHTTMVLVTHNVFQAKRLASRVAFLFDGELVETLPTEQFFAAPRDARTQAFVSGELVY
jgi:tungstate transport system ATP-binding protein